MEITRQTAEYWLDAAREMWHCGKNTMEIAEGLSGRFARRFDESDVYNRIEQIKPERTAA